jgi:peptidyl-prolyl cis-trans isomerase SurA
MMKKLLLILSVFLTPITSLEAARPVDEIVAVVENDVILRSELNRALRSSRRPGGMSREQHEKQVLEELITNKAHQLAAVNSGVTVSDEEVDEAVQLIAAQNKITVAFLKKVLAHQGKSYTSFREEIRKQLLQRNFHQAQLRNLVQVTDSEVDNYLALYGKKNTSRIVTQTKAKHILLRPGERLSNTSAQAKLQEFRTRIVAGEDFDSIARAHSDDTASALKGGDLGWLEPEQGSPEFRRAMNRLKPGEISKPFKTAFGWHIVKVEDRRKQESANAAERTSAREKIQQRKIEENLDLLVRRLRQQAYVEDRLYNDEYDY